MALADYLPLAIDAAQRAGVDPALLAAVVDQESSWNARAQSPAGAKGLTQLVDATARGLGVTDPFDPAQSLDGGARFLGGLLAHYSGDVSLALAAYDAGPGAVDQYGGIPPFAETQRYVPAVLAKVDQYRAMLNGGTIGGGVINADTNATSAVTGGVLVPVAIVVAALWIAGVV